MIPGSVVVVGGGIIGCSTAWQLARRGVKTTLLEKSRLTSGTTWHAAGLIGTQKGSKVISEMTGYSRSLYSSFGDDIGWKGTGSLALCRSEDIWPTLLHVSQICKSLGRECQVLRDKREISSLHPFVDTSDVLGAIYTNDGDGLVNPADITVRIAQMAKEEGATILENCQATSFQVRKRGEENSYLDQVVGIKTNDGREFDCEGGLLIAGGAWSRSLLFSILGREVLPTAIIPHQYLLFEPEKNVGYHLPVLRDFDSKFYLKPDAGGSFLLGIFEGDPLPHLPSSVSEANKERGLKEGIPADISDGFGLFDDDLDKMGSWLSSALSSVPSLSSLGVKACLHGPDTHSADHNPIMGLVGGTKNVYVATGFNSQGIQCGAGAGLAMSEWMVDGYPTSFNTDFEPANITRFASDFSNDAEMVEGRACEGYGTLYSAHYPGQQVESHRIGRRLKLHEEYQKGGARFGEAFFWERPLYFLSSSEHEKASSFSPISDPVWLQRNSEPITTPRKYSFDYRETEWFQAEKREALLCRNSCAMFDLSPFGKIKVEGERALEVLQWLCTNEIDRPAGSVVYTFLCDDQGGVIADVTVSVSEKSFLIITPASLPKVVEDSLQEAAEKFSLSQKDGEFVVRDITEEMEVFAVNGPKSRVILEKIVDPSVSLNSESFPPYSFQMVRIESEVEERRKEEEEGIEVMMLRVSYSGSDGWELHVPTSSAQKVYHLIHQAAKEADVEFGNAGLFSLMNSLRIEKGYLHYGHDVSRLETPFDVGMGWICRKDGGDYRGKEAHMKQRKNKKKQLLTVVPLVQSDKSLSLWGMGSELIYRNGEKVGYITSGGYSHSLETPIGLAHCDTFVIDNNQDKYEVECPTGTTISRFPVRLSSRPLI